METENRFEAALRPALLLGVVTNVYIAFVVYSAAGPVLTISPVVSAIFFALGHILLKKKSISARTAFFFLTLVVAVEIAIHTHFVGWKAGFYYYTFLMPIVFILNQDWKKITVIWYNLSVLVYSFILWYLEHDSNGVFEVPANIARLVKFINLAGTGTIVVFIMIYFRNALHKKDHLLMKMNSELEEQNIEISAQNEHKKVLLKEVHHRVKNNLQIISSLLSLQSRNVNDEETAKILKESKRRIDAIAAIHQKLYQEGDITRMSFDSFMKEVVDNQQILYPRVNCELSSVKLMLSLDTAIPLGLIVSELISNAYKHAFPGVDDPRLVIKMTKATDGQIDLIIRDNGPGFSESFSSDDHEGLGIEIINGLCDQINAKIEFRQQDGAEIQITFNENLSDK